MRARTFHLERLALAGLLALSLAACGKTGTEAGEGGGTDIETVPTASAAPSAKAPTTSERPSASASPEPKVMGASKKFAEVPRGNDSDAKARLVGLEAGTGDGVETLTFTFADTKVLPKWRVRYVDAVRAHPEDEPIPLTGNAFLEVGFALTNPNTGGRLAVPSDLTPDQPQVKAVLLTRNLGGTLAFGVGLDARTKFRARELSDPTRLVVEVRTR